MRQWINNTKQKCSWPGRAIRSGGALHCLLKPITFFTTGVGLCMLPLSLLKSLMWVACCNQQYQYCFHYPVYRLCFYKLLIWQCYAISIVIGLCTTSLLQEALLNLHVFSFTCILSLFLCVCVCVLQASLA